MATNPIHRLLPVALLVTGIGVHGVRIIAQHEDAQRGTAFAMFASVDIGATRKVEATGVGPGGRPLDLEIPPALERERQGLVDSPTQGRAAQFANLLASQSWFVSSDLASVGGTATLHSVEVRVLGLRATGRSLSRMVLVQASTAHTISDRD